MIKPPIGTITWALHEGTWDLRADCCKTFPTLLSHSDSPWSAHRSSCNPHGVDQSGDSKKKWPIMLRELDAQPEPSFPQKEPSVQGGPFCVCKWGQCSHHLAIPHCLGICGAGSTAVSPLCSRILWAVSSLWIASSYFYEEHQEHLCHHLGDVIPSCYFLL